MYISIDKGLDTPMTKQIYLYIKEQILSGNLKGNSKLASTRKQADELEVSRNVVLNAYNQLFAEGYLYSKDRSGIYVAEGIEINIDIKRIDEYNSNKTGLLFNTSANIVDFRTGVPNLSLFPKNKWGKLYRQVCIDTSYESLDY